MRDAGIDRRAFLGFAAAGAGGLLLPTIVRPKAKVFDMGRGLRRPGKIHAVIFDRRTGSLMIAPGELVDGRMRLRSDFVLDASESFGQDRVDLALFDGEGRGHTTIHQLDTKRLIRGGTLHMLWPFPDADAGSLLRSPIATS